MIRELRDDDSFMELTALIHRAYAPLAAQGMHYWGTHQSVEDTRERCGEGETWLYEQDGVVVGTITLVRHGRGCMLYEEPQVAKFGQFAVDPAFQGRGVGAAMMDHVEARAAELGASVLACDTSEHAHGLIRMYRARGYRLMGHVDWRPHVNYESVLLALKIVSPEL